MMGYCEGGDLHTRLKARKGELLPEAQVVEWFVQIALALQVWYACMETHIHTHMHTYMHTHDTTHT